MNVLCIKSGNSWEKNLSYALLALRTVTHESTVFCPSEMVHGKIFKTPEALLYKKSKNGGGEVKLMTECEYVFDLINRMKGCQEFAVENMDLTRDDRKRYCDRDAVEWTFKTGDKVLY